ncbi:General transcription factor IIF subunit 2 [Portunus trituberculatus]|uniref:General transcription factor IIF subunit 2 n=1 Tax=Portunus trituberculatus TaxID=210409 RepID=A0A5B7KAP9_PORTR|nr:General transcription factor IIF subunit 2 [Portunus trituberculatus]
MDERRKAEGKKARDDKDKVMEMLFAAFEKHQYYNIKDLQKLTRQPIVRRSVVMFVTVIQTCKVFFLN